MKIGSHIGEGKTAEVYEWGEREVVKLFHDRHMAFEEAKNAEIISRLGGVKVPAFANVVEIEGRIGLVYERIHGQTMLRQIGTTQESIAENARLMAALHFDIHQVKPDFESNELSGHEQDEIIQLLKTALKR